MKEYLPLATVVNEDGSTVELRGERTGHMYYAFRAVNGWREAYGEMVTDRRIEVYNGKRKLYTMNLMMEMKKGKQG